MGIPACCYGPGSETPMEKYQKGRNRHGNNKA